MTYLSCCGVEVHNPDSECYICPDCKEWCSTEDTLLEEDTWEARFRLWWRRGEWTGEEVITWIKTNVLLNESLIGKKVRIVSKPYQGSHRFKVGQIVEITEIDDSEWPYRCNGKNDYWYCKRSDFELIEEEGKDE